MGDALLTSSVESAGFAARFGPVSGTAHFIRVLRTQPEMAQLRAASIRSSGAAALVADRIGAMVAVPVEPGFEHPHDVAIAALLFVLATTRHRYFESALGSTAGQASLWWGRKVGERMKAALASVERASAGLAWFGTTHESVVRGEVIAAGVRSRATSSPSVLRPWTGGRELRTAVVTRVEVGPPPRVPASQAALFPRTGRVAGRVSVRADRSAVVDLKQ